jgi:glycerol-3-phosphate acyltransferase PlsY
MTGQLGAVAPDAWPLWACAWIAAYFIGSIPVGYLMARSRGVDIRAKGSGNIGATNVGRVLGRCLGALCLVLDMLKGLTPTLGAWLFLGSTLENSDWWLSDTDLVIKWLGIAAATIVGHVFPVWLGFRGGKGVATGLGAMLGAVPILSLAAIGAAAVWLVSIRVCRYVGLSSCLAAASMPAWVVLAGWLVVRPRAHIDARHALLPYLVIAASLSVLVISRHRANLVRTFRGTEPKLGRR